MARVNDYLQLARISNLPTCVSNVLVGAAIGASTGAAIIPSTVALVAVGISLLYVAGMALNDVCDVAVDTKERPTRPIPSGRISRTSALVFASVTMFGGIALLAFASMHAFAAGVLLAITIISYDLLHQRFRTSILLMGLCRGLVYVTATAAVVWPLPIDLLWPMTLAMVLYVTCVTWVSTAEAGPHVGRGARVAGWAGALIPLLVWPLYGSQQWPCAALAAGALIVAGVHANLLLRHQPPRTMRAVMAMLANICLIDTFFLLLLGQLALAAIAVACYVLTRLLHRRIMGS